MKFVIDTEKKIITVYGSPGLKELAKDLMELSEKGFENYSVHAVPITDIQKNQGTFGYVSTDTFTSNEGIIPPLYY